MKNDASIVGFLAVGLLVVGVVIGIPLVHAMQLSLYKLDSFVGSPEWVGLANYTRVLSDPEFWRAFGNGTLIALAAIVLQIVLGIGIAMVLNQAFVGQGLARGFMILP